MWDAAADFVFIPVYIVSLLDLHAAFQLYSVQS